MNKTKISKKMSFILRHDDTVELEEGGWIGLDYILGRIGIGREKLEEIVKEDEKGRYEIRGEKIRAVQGHSVEVEMGYEEMEPPEILYHGTSFGVMGIILRDGIKRMSRQFVHLSEDRETAERVGSRHGEVVVLEIECRRMGEKFYRARNGVWLVGYVDPEYIRK